MNIETKLQEIAAEYFPEMSYTLGSMTEIDEQLDRKEPPFLWVVFPATGGITYTNGRVKERLRALVGFFDLVERDANGEDNMTVYRTMAAKAETFINVVNTCGYFEPLTDIPTNIYTEVGAANVTGLILDIELKERTGRCVV